MEGQSGKKARVAPAAAAAGGTRATRSSRSRKIRSRRKEAPGAGLRWTEPARRRAGRAWSSDTLRSIWSRTRCGASVLEGLLTLVCSTPETKSKASRSVLSGPLEGKRSLLPSSQIPSPSLSLNIFRALPLSAYGFSLAPLLAILTLVLAWWLAGRR